PVPPAASRRSVRIVNGDGEAFGPRRRIAPGERRRYVAPTAAESVVDLLVGDLDVRLDFGALEREFAGGVRGERQKRDDKCDDTTHGIPLTPKAETVAGILPAAGEEARKKRGPAARRPSGACRTVRRAPR